MLPQSHRQESLSRAFVTAIAAKAGVKCLISAESDLGIDGYFKLVKPMQTLRPRRVRGGQENSSANTIVKIREYGLPLEFQLKSSTTCNIRHTDVKYEAAPDDYDKLVDSERATPVLLILCALPAEDSWLEVTDDHTKLGGRCFYHYASGPLTTNSGSITLTIPKSNLLTADSLLTLLNTYYENYTVTNIDRGQNAKAN